MFDIEMQKTALFLPDSKELKNYKILNLVNQFVKFRSGAK